MGGMINREIRSANMQKTVDLTKAFTHVLLLNEF